MSGANAIQKQPVETPPLSLVPAESTAAQQLTAHYSALVGQLSRSKFSAATVLPQLGHVLGANISRLSGNADYVSGKMSTAEMEKQLLQVVTQITKSSNYKNLSTADRQALSQVASAIKELITSAEDGVPLSTADLQKALMRQSEKVKPGADTAEAQQVTTALAGLSIVLQKIAAPRMPATSDTNPANPTAPKPDAPAAPQVSTLFTTSIQKVFHYVYEAVDDKFRQPQTVVAPITAQLEQICVFRPSRSPIPV